MSISSTIIYYVYRGTRKALLTDPLVPSIEKNTNLNKQTSLQRASMHRADSLRIPKKGSGCKRRKGERQLLLTIIFQSFVPTKQKKLENASGLAQGAAAIQERTRNLFLPKLRILCTY